MNVTTIDNITLLVSLYLINKKIKNKLKEVYYYTPRFPKCYYVEFLTREKLVVSSIRRLMWCQRNRNNSKKGAHSFVPRIDVSFSL